MTGNIVLIVSNDEQLLEKLTDPIKRSGYEIQVNKDGEEAFESIQKLRPLAIIADLYAQKIDAIELCWMVREHEKQIWMPFIIISPSDDSELRLNCLRTGADDFLVHPFTIREILIRLEALISRFRHWYQLEARGVSVFFGELGAFLLAELVQWLHNQKRTGRLWVSHLYQRGSIYLENGNILSAHLGNQEGENALFRMFDWKKGKFEFEIGEYPTVPNIKKDTMEILLEYSKKMDENKSRIIHSMKESSQGS